MPSPDQGSTHSSLDDGSLKGMPNIHIPSAADALEPIESSSEPVGDDWYNAAGELVAQELRRGRNLSAVQIAEENLSLVLKHCADSPIQVAGAYRMLAETYEAMETPALAIENWRAAAQILDADEGPQQLFKAEISARLACCYIGEGNFSGAERCLREARAGFAAFDGTDLRALRRAAEAYLLLGKTYEKAGRGEFAVKLLHHAVSQAREANGAASPLHQESLLALAGAYLTCGKLAVAEGFYEIILQNAIEHESPPGRQHFFAHAGFTRVAFASHPPDPVRGLNFALYALSTFDPADEEQLGTAAYLEFVVARQWSQSPELREVIDARTHFERALRFARRSEEAGIPFVAMIAEPFADYLAARGNLKREGELRAELLASTIESFGPYSAEVLKERRGLLDMYRRARDHDATATEAERVADIVHKLSGGLSEEYVQALRDWGAAALHANDAVLAESLVWTARRIAKRLPNAKFLRMELVDDLAAQAEFLGQARRAIAFRHAATEMARRLFGDEHAITAENRRIEARLLAEVDRPAEALSSAVRALRYFKSTGDKNEIALSHATLAYVRGCAHDFERSELGFKRSLRMMRELGQRGGSDYIRVAQEYVMMRADAAQFYSNPETARDAYRLLRKVLGMTRAASMYEEYRTLDLLETGMELTEMLDLTQESELYRLRYDQLKKRLG